MISLTVGCHCDLLHVLHQHRVYHISNICSELLHENVMQDGITFVWTPCVRTKKTFIQLLFHNVVCFAAVCFKTNVNMPPTERTNKLSDITPAYQCQFLSFTTQAPPHNIGLHRSIATFTSVQLRLESEQSCWEKGLQQNGQALHHHI